MALFFDQSWFDEVLKARGLTQQAVAAAMGLSPEALAEIWKDQRIMRVAELRALAELLGVSMAEAAKRAGLGAVEPEAGDLAEEIRQMRREIQALKEMLAQFLAQQK